MDVSIIVPCFNEALNIPLLLQRLSDAMKDRAQTWREPCCGNATHGVSFTRLRRASVVATPLTWEAVLVDDASVDDTQQVLAHSARQFPELSIQRHFQNLGMVAAWATGCAAARGRIVIVMDADMQYAPEDVPRLLDELERSGADLSQGYRAQTIEHSMVRKFLSVVLSATLNFAFGTRLHDAKSNFFACRREVLADLLTLRGRYRYFQHLFSMAAIAKGYRIAQIPVTFHPRRAGQSFIRSPLLFSLRALPDLPKACVGFRRLRRESRARTAAVAAVSATADKYDRRSSVEVSGGRRPPQK